MVKEKFINDVLHDSAVTKNLQEELPFIADVEKQALVDMASQCPEIANKLGETRWKMSAKKWNDWKDCDAESLGEAVQTVVGKLDAPHLRPSLIHHQLLAGNDAASFSYLTLMMNLPDFV